MFLKQYNYKPRSNSQSSQTSAGVAGSPPKEEAKVAEQTNTSATSAAIAGRRRSSASGGAYAGLNAMKRGSQDEQKKASWQEQKTGGSGGILGGMWHNFTKGSN
ncbi:hypothetical protein H2200_009093 [Cladophialophora chaetospira]|uniref:Uncharacterized protein n=1 Tax=Cladophialophora chaetospira TaxID=386627 RepID=A0AA38X3I4_9EURO|nr:hypothetical protein H2200_009093 [Cladophialophora chaetospira]